MSSHVNDNLERWRAISGGRPIYGEEGRTTFTVEGIEFVTDYDSGSTRDRFFLVKHPDHARSYMDLLRRHTGATIVELGIAEGGSAVLAALLAQPTKLVAVDLEPVRLAALDEFAADRGLTEVIRAHYAVDQGDRVGLAAIIDQEVGQDPIDLIFDDASHELELTRSSFETLFPRLRPGGLFVIEDWNSAHVWEHEVRLAFQAMPAEERRAQLAQHMEAMAREGPAAAAPRPRPLSDLVIELVILQALPVDVVASVSINPYDVRIERGSAELDPATFRLSDVVTDHFDYLP